MRTAVVGSHFDPDCLPRLLRLLLELLLLLHLLHRLPRQLLVEGKGWSGRKVGEEWWTEFSGLETKLIRSISKIPKILNFRENLLKFMAAIV